MMAALNALAGEYMELAARLRIDQYEVPVNAAEEAARTEAAYRSGGEHDPQFVFKPVPPDAISDLAAFGAKLGSRDNAWLGLLGRTVDYMRQTLVDCQARDPQAITDRTTAMFGGLAADTLDRAIRQLQAPYTASTEERDIDAARLAEIFRQALANVSLTDWSVLVEPQMNATMDVTGERREIRVRAGSSFSRTMATRLLVHEIGCHVFRAASGMRQPIRLAGFGLGDYLATEEGLAAFLEEGSGLQDAADSRRFALRYLAASRALQGGFFDVYRELREYADAAQAFSTMVRAKRGFTDTSKPGCHVKDKIYFEGLEVVTDHLSRQPDDLPLLFTGKVSLTMLPLVRESLDCGDLLPAAFTAEQIPLLREAL